jgi:sRNA-binding protein
MPVSMVCDGKFLNGDKANLFQRCLNGELAAERKAARQRKEERQAKVAARAAERAAQREEEAKTSPRPRKRLSLNRRVRQMEAMKIADDAPHADAKAGELNDDTAAYIAFPFESQHKYPHVLRQIAVVATADGAPHADC